MNAVTRQEPLGHESQDFAINGNAYHVEQSILKHQWEPQSHDHSLRFGNQLFKYVQRRGLNPRRMKGVLTAVTGNAKLR